MREVKKCKRLIERRRIFSILTRTALEIVALVMAAVGFERRVASTGASTFESGTAGRCRT